MRGKGRKKRGKGWGSGQARVCSRVRGMQATPGSGYGFVGSILFGASFPFYATTRGPC